MSYTRSLQYFLRRIDKVTTGAIFQVRINVILNLRWRLVRSLVRRIIRRPHGIFVVAFSPAPALPLATNRLRFMGGKGKVPRDVLDRVHLYLVRVVQRARFVCIAHSAAISTPGRLWIEGERPSVRAAMSGCR